MQTTLVFLYENRENCQLVLLMFVIYRQLQALLHLQHPCQPECVWHEIRQILEYKMTADRADLAMNQCLGIRLEIFKLLEAFEQSNLFLQHHVQY